MSELDNSFNCEAFFAGLSKKIEFLQSEYRERNRTEAFNFVGAALYAPGENTLSRILAFFFDPAETHGQEDLFLRIFCKHILGWSEQLIDERLGCGVVVRTEHITDENRRIDITIAFGRQFIVGIENKPWATDQVDQVKDYCDFMERWGHGKADFLCLYLSPDGGAPSEASITAEAIAGYKATGRLKYISYRKNIMAMLEQFAKACQAQTVQVFIDDVRKHIRNLFEGKQNMTIKKSIGEYLTSNDEHIEAAIQTHMNIESVWQKLWGRACEELPKAAKAEGIQEKLSMFEHWAGDPADEARSITFESELWKWSLIFNNARYRGRDFQRLIEFKNGMTLDKNGLAAMQIHFGASWHASPPAPARVGIAPDKYGGPWKESDEPWTDMMTPAVGSTYEGCSQFTATVLEWYNLDKQRIVEFLAKQEE